MLDVPNFFWESEPTLYPLYIAVREYLEIKPRIQVLNERCRVFLDLAEILSDSIADNRTSRESPSPPLPAYHETNTRKDQTWIIIVLILISIVVTCGEVFLRFGLLSTRQNATSTTSFAAHLLSRALGAPLQGQSAAPGVGAGTGAGAGALQCDCACPGGNSSIT